MIICEENNKLIINVMTNPYGNIEKSKVLVIGHDPRLTKSSTLADYSFFADYYFRPEPTQPKERAKYKLAVAVFDYILYLTKNKFKAEEIYITNLCNEALPAVKGKTVYILQIQAEKGLEDIRSILEHSDIEIIFAMSWQVNYWLQKLGFYHSNDSFLKDSEPKSVGVSADPPYYEAQGRGAFKLICAQTFIADDKYKLVPILHVKNWPLKKVSYINAYEKAYNNYLNMRV